MSSSLFSLAQNPDPTGEGPRNGIAPSFAKDITSEGPSTCGATYMKCSRPVSQKCSATGYQDRRRWGTPGICTCHSVAPQALVTAGSSPYSSLEAGVKEQYLQIYGTVLDRLPWLKASLNDFVKDGSIMDFARLVYSFTALQFFHSHSMYIICTD